MSYELWDDSTSNRVGAYATEREALEVVAGIVRGYRSRRARQITWLSLLAREGTGRRIEIASGPELAALALEHVPSNEGEAPVPRHRKRVAA